MTASNSAPSALICVAIAALVLGMPAGSARADSSVPVDVFGSLGDQNVVFPDYHGYLGMTATNVGDVNGDGIEDTGAELGDAWINFSAASMPSTSSAGQAGWDGLRLTGVSLWPGIAGVGDVNGDGLADVAVESTSTIYVVFGRRDSATIDLAHLGDAGFEIHNAGGGVATGFGTVDHGVAYEDTMLTGVGDQNGDGRADIAFGGGGGAQVVYTPNDPAGASLDALSAPGFTLATNSEHGSDAYVGDLGDLSGDGRDDLAVFWEDSDTQTTYAVGAYSPGPGAKVNLLDVAAAGTGFEIELPGYHIENGIVVGDQNGDGRRDLGIVAFRAADRQMFIAYTPGAGTDRSGVSPPADEGKIVDVYNGNVIDVGDQDGDGRDDLAFSDVVRLSSSGEVSPTYSSNGEIRMNGVGGIIVAAIKDRNDDGRRELVSVFADPYTPDPPYDSTWHMNVFLSAPPPSSQSLDPPTMTGNGLEFAGTFVTDPAGGMRTLGASASVQIDDPATVSPPETFAAPGVINANARTTRATVDVNPGSARLVPGRSYRYRMKLTNSRGTTGMSAWAPFVYEPDAVSPALSLMKLTPATFRAARSGASIARRRTGTTVSYRVSAAATTSFEVERAVPGVKRGHRCVKPTRRTSRSKRCTRFVRVHGRFRHQDSAGGNRFRFSGRVGGRALKPGRYRLDATPKNAAGDAGRTSRSRFRIVR